jgi:hypothetical protein
MAIPLLSWEFGAHSFSLLPLFPDYTRPEMAFKVSCRLDCTLSHLPDWLRWPVSDPVWSDFHMSHLMVIPTVWSWWIVANPSITLTVFPDLACSAAMPYALICVLKLSDLAHAGATSAVPTSHSTERVGAFTPIPRSPHLHQFRTDVARELGQLDGSTVSCSFMTV